MIWLVLRVRLRSTFKEQSISKRFYALRKIHIVQLIHQSNCLVPYTFHIACVMYICHYMIVVFS